MQGTGVPIVTPFDDDQEIVDSALQTITEWLVDRGVDFVVPCGSNGESVLLTPTEQERVVELVADASSVPVMAGAGHPGFKQTRNQVMRAAEAGADGVLVVTPYYFEHDAETLVSYYRRLADASSIPLYLYNVPSKTDVRLEPETIEELATHENIHGIKDSTGNVDAFERIVRKTPAAFDVLIGHGGLYAHGLSAGADGGILALANVVPELTVEIDRLFTDGRMDEAHALGSDLVELNRAITARYGVAGVKAAMQIRGLPAGQPRLPHQPARTDVVDKLEVMIETAL